MVKYVYLDQNHVSMVSGITPPVTPELRARLDALRSDGRVQLVVSLAHVIETANWSDTDARARFVDWVDSHPVLWVPNDAVVKQWSAVRFLRVMLGAVDEAEPADRLLGVLPMMSVDQLADMGTRRPIVQERYVGPLVEQMVGSDALKAAIHQLQQSTLAEKTSLLAGAQGDGLAPDRRRVFSSTVDAAMTLGLLPKRLDGGRALDEETLRQFVDGYARADIPSRRFAEQLHEAFVDLRRAQLPERPLDGVHMDDFVPTAGLLGRIRVNDLLDRHHALATLFVNAYVCDREFAPVVTRALRNVPRTARVFARLAEAVEWLEAPAP